MTKKVECCYSVMTKAKAPECHSCGEKLNNLEVRQSVTKEWNVGLGLRACPCKNEKCKGIFHEATYIEAGSFAETFGDAYCPHCGEDLDINNEKDAIDFLRGMKKKKVD